MPHTDHRPSAREPPAGSRIAGYLLPWQVDLVVGSERTWQRQGEQISG
jgi:hypothetical protein